MRDTYMIRSRFNHNVQPINRVSATRVSVPPPPLDIACRSLWLIDASYL